MRLRSAMLAALCLGLNACALPEVSASSPPPAAGPRKTGRAEAIDDVIVVRKAGEVSVLRRLDAQPVWSVPQRPDDPITKARLARGSVVVVRRSQTVEVYELGTGKLRFSKEKAGAVGVSWTALFADSAQCQPDCSLRGYDLGTGAELWAGPPSLPGKVMVEPGEPQNGKLDPPGEVEGPMRAAETNVIAVRGADAVMLLDAVSGRELSRVPAPEAGVALGSPTSLVLLEWSAPKDCKSVVIGRNAVTGEVAWQQEAGTRQPTVCVNGWRPQINDGLLILIDPKGLTKVVEVETGTVVWGGTPFGDPAVAVNKRAVVTYSPGRLAGYQPEKNDNSPVTRLWAADITETSKIAGLTADFERLYYTTEYEGSPRGVGWVRDMKTGKRLWYGDGEIPLGVDGDRVIAETPSGEIRLERMVSTG